MSRLIDAIRLRTQVDMLLDQKIITPNTMVKMHRLIDEQPTAYDVEKVVAEFEDNTVEFELFGICSDYIPKHIAINAVRKGGVE